MLLSSLLIRLIWNLFIARVHLKIKQPFSFAYLLSVLTLAPFALPKHRPRHSRKEGRSLGHESLVQPASRSLGTGCGVCRQEPRLMSLLLSQLCSLSTWKVTALHSQLTGHSLTAPPTPFPSFLLRRVLPCSSSCFGTYSFASASPVLRLWACTHAWHSQP